MTLQVVGPRALELVNMMSEFSGMSLYSTGDDVHVSTDGLIDPFESRTLQTLIKDCIKTET
jgi:hypothetical protein